MKTISISSEGARERRTCALFIGANVLKRASSLIEAGKYSNLFIITDPCLGWKDTEKLLREAAAFRKSSGRGRKLVIDELASLRGKIDGVDESLVALLSKRLECAEKIGSIKKSHTLPVLDTKREKTLKEKRLALVHKHGIDPDLVDGIFELIIEKSKKIQKVK